MRGERPRAARYSFVAKITVTDLDSGYQAQESTQNLSLYGCKFAPRTPTPIGTRIRVQIFHDGDAFEAQARVVNAQPFGAAGIAFTNVSERDQEVLDKWVAELRSKQSQRQSVDVYRLSNMESKAPSSLRKTGFC